LRHAARLGHAYLEGVPGCLNGRVTAGDMLMDAPNQEFVRAASLEELKAKGRIVVHGHHRPVLVVYDQGRVFALDNRCPHMGFPLERGSVEDGILTCHWHHARFDLESGCTICGRMTFRLARSKCATATSG
jgi:nitrite reductase/ring-hydroxylating ferredoxin subunit